MKKVIELKPNQCVDDLTHDFRMQAHIIFRANPTGTYSVFKNRFGPSNMGELTADGMVELLVRSANFE